MKLRRITIVFMGDSITEGQYVDPAVRWTSILERDLVEYVKTTGIELCCVNRGVSGETTRMGLERFPDAVQSESPDVVMIQFGMNDCNCWESDRGLPRVSENAFVANVAEMIARCRRFGAQQIIIATNPCTLRETVMVSGERYEAANARYSDLVRMAATTSAVTLCDIRHAFESLRSDQLRPLLLPPPDLLHLTPAGHVFYARTCLPVVARAIARAAPGREPVGV